QRLDVGAVGELGVGHDRRRIAVDEHDLEPLAAQRLARLAARVVELARLTDDDGTGADDEDAFEIGATRHVLPVSGLRAGPEPYPLLSSINVRKSSNR